VSHLQQQASNQVATQAQQSLQQSQALAFLDLPDLPNVGLSLLPSLNLPFGGSRGQQQQQQQWQQAGSVSTRSGVGVRWEGAEGGLLACCPPPTSCRYKKREAVGALATASSCQTLS